MPRALQALTVILLIGNIVGTLFVGVFAGWALVTFFTNIGDKPENIPVGGIGTSRVSDCSIPTPPDPLTSQPIPIAAYIGQASEFYKLPASYIAAIVEQESAFDPTARSHVGASGFMQLMPSTFEDLQAGGLEYLKTLLYGKGRSYPFADKNLREVYADHFEEDGVPPTRTLSGTSSEDITNPKYNIFLGTSYLRQQYDIFSRGGDGQPKGAHGRHTGNELLSIMAAAYNAGPGAVEEFRGIPPYEETQKYVNRVMTELYPKYQACESEIQDSGEGGAHGLIEPLASYTSTGDRINPPHRKHDGIDYVAETGTPVLASKDGTVTYRGWANGYGNLIILNHGEGLETYYAHLSSFGSTEMGQSVSQGQTIGAVGSTGRSSGPHLHFEARLDGTPFDPFLDQ